MKPVLSLICCLFLSGCQLSSDQPKSSPRPVQAATEVVRASSAAAQTGLLASDGTESMTEKFVALLPLEGDPLLSAVYLSNGYWSFIKPDGSPAFEGEFEQTTSFRGGVAVVQEKDGYVGGRYGFLNPDGSYAVKPTFEFADWAGFHDGLCEVRSGETSAYVSPDGEIQIPYAREIFKTGPFKGGRIHYTEGEEEVFLDTQGKEVFRTPSRTEFLYGEDLWLAGEENPIFLDAQGKNPFDKTFQQARPFNDGLAAVKIDGKWGLMDKQGELVLKPTYQEARSPKGQLFAAKSEGKWGMVNLNREQVVPFEYDDIGLPGERAVPVAKGKLWGLSDLDGQLVAQPKYKSLFPWGDSEHFIFVLETSAQ